MPIENTLSIIKPDATKRNLTGLINAKFEKAGLKVFGAFERIDKDGKKKAVLTWSDKDLSTAFGFIKDNGDFTGSADTSFTFTGHASTNLSTALWIISAVLTVDAPIEIPFFAF